MDTWEEMEDEIWSDLEPMRCEADTKDGLVCLSPLYQEGNLKPLYIGDDEPNGTYCAGARKHI